MNVSSNLPSPPRPISGGGASWLQLAAHPATVKRAVITAFVVGAALIAINHGPAILQGQVTVLRVIQMGLTVLVPYAVSTVSSVSTRRELSAATEQPGGVARSTR